MVNKLSAGFRTSTTPGRPDLHRPEAQGFNVKLSDLDRMEEHLVEASSTLQGPILETDRNREQ